MKHSILRREMFIFRFVSRFLSLFVAGIIFFAVCSWYPSFYDSWHFGRDGSKGEYYTIFFVIQVVIAIPILFIWCSDYLAGLEWGDQTWRTPHWCRATSLFACPASLIKFTGWVFLLLPALIFIWNKIL